MDVLSDLLHRARASNAVVRKTILPPPWSITLADQVPLSAVAALEGSTSISLGATAARRPPRPRTRCSRATSR